MYRAALTMIVASIIGVCIIGSVQTPAHAYDPGFYFSKKYYQTTKNLGNATRMTGSYSNADRALSRQQSRARAQRIFTRASRAAFNKPVSPAHVEVAAGRAATVGEAAANGSSTVATGTRIAPVLMRAGLVGAAAGIWTLNGVMIYNAVHCGEALNCPEPLRMSTEFRKAESLASGNGSGGFFRTYDGNGQLVGSGAVLDMDYKVSGNNTTTTISYYGESTLSNKRAGSVSMLNKGGGTGTFNDSASIALAATYGTPLPSGQTNPIVRTGTFSGGGFRMFQFATSDVGGTQTGVQRPMGPEFPSNQNYTWENPVFDTGDVEVQVVGPQYEQLPGDYVPSPDQQQMWLETMKNDPEMWPELIPKTKEELEQQHGPERNTWTNPDGSTTTEYEDGTTVTTYPDGTQRIQQENQPDKWTGPTTNPENGEQLRDQQDYPQPEPNPNPPPNENPNNPPTGGGGGNGNPPTSGGGGNGDPTPPGNADDDPSCKACQTGGIIIPPVAFEEKFPFSLVLGFRDLIVSLNRGSAAPTIELGFFGAVDIGKHDSLIKKVRGIETAICCGLILLGSYILITGRKD